MTAGAGICRWRRETAPGAPRTGPAIRGRFPWSDGKAKPAGLAGQFIAFCRTRHARHFGEGRFLALAGGAVDHDAMNSPCSLVSGDRLRPPPCVSLEELLQFSYGMRT